MSTIPSSSHEGQDSKRGAVVSAIFHGLIIALLFLPFLTIPNPPPGQEGILVNLGLPDVGQGEENGPPPAAPKPTPEPKPEVKPEVTPPPAAKPQVTKPTPQKEVIRTEDPDAIALRKEKEAAKAKADADARAKAEADAKAKAEADAKAKADAAAAAKAQALKDKLKGGLSGSGGGKGNTGTSGNQGDPNGDPNADKLKGISTGAGRVSGGLGGRGVRTSPTVTDKTQEQGTVVIYVCVNADGAVTKATLTQKGTTATSQTLIEKAIANAKIWKFAPAAEDEQCGYITYNFVLK